MPRATASSDPSKLMVPRGTVLSIVLWKGRYSCKSKAMANRALMHGLTLGVSVDMSKDIKGDWVIHLSQMGVHLLRQKHGWKNPLLTKRNKTGKRRAALDKRHPKQKVRAQKVIEDWVPGEARRSKYDEKEVLDWTYGESSDIVQTEDAKPAPKAKTKTFNWTALVDGDDDD